MSLYSGRGKAVQKRIGPLKARSFEVLSLSPRRLKHETEQDSGDPFGARALAVFRVVAVAVIVQLGDGC